MFPVTLNAGTRYTITIDHNSSNILDSVYLGANTVQDNYGCATLNVDDNSTWGNCGNNTGRLFYVYGNIIFENNQTYLSSVSSTSTNPFNISLGFDYNLFSSITANLSYNGSSYAGIQTGSLGLVNFSASATAPITNSITIIPFYWIIGLTNISGTYYYNSSFQNQTVDPLTALSVGAYNCSAGLFPAYNFTFANETDRGIINNSVQYTIFYGLGNTTARVVNGSFNSPTSFVICINQTLTNYSIGYGDIYYGISPFVSRHFYLFSNSLVSNSTTINNTLYDLTSSSATAFQFTLTDTSLNTLPSYYIALLRWYPDINSYQVAEMGLTDSQGQTVFQVKTNDVDYRIAVYDFSGNLINLYNPIRLVCATSPCTYTISIPTTTVNLVNILKVQTNLTWDSTNFQYIFTWSDPTQTTQTMNLTVYLEGGLSESVLCSTTSTGFTGIMICPIGNQSGQIRGIVYRTASPPQVIASDVQNLFDSLISKTGGTTIALLISLILLVFLFMIGAYAHPALALIFGTLAFIPLLAFGGINYGLIAGIGVLGGIVWHFIKKT
jgi:hypothetical protein